MDKTARDEFIRLRERTGLSQDGIQGACGVSGPHISGIESGRTKNPGIDTLKKLAPVYGVSAFYLMSLAGYLDGMALPNGWTPEELAVAHKAVENLRYEKQQQAEAVAGLEASPPKSGRRVRGKAS